MEEPRGPGAPGGPEASWDLPLQEVPGLKSRAEGTCPDARPSLSSFSAATLSCSTSCWSESKSWLLLAAAPVRSLSVEAMVSTPSWTCRRTQVRPPGV